MIELTPQLALREAHWCRNNDHKPVITLPIVIDPHSAAVNQCRTGTVETFFYCKYVSGGELADWIVGKMFDSLVPY